MINFGIMKRILSVGLLLICCWTLCAQPAPHPRLLPSPRALEEDAPWYAHQVDSTLRAFCDAVLDMPPVERELRGRRLLGLPS